MEKLYNKWLVIGLPLVLAIISAYFFKVLHLIREQDSVSSFVSISTVIFTVLIVIFYNTLIYYIYGRITSAKPVAWIVTMAVLVATSVTMGIWKIYRLPEIDSEIKKLWLFIMVNTTFDFVYPLLALYFVWKKSKKFAREEYETALS